MRLTAALIILASSMAATGADRVRPGDALA